VECRQPVDSQCSRLGGLGKGSKREVGGLVGERETATTEAVMATVARRLGSTVSSRLVDTSWGCAFGVGGPSNWDLPSKSPMPAVSWIGGSKGEGEDLGIHISN